MKTIYQSLEFERILEKITDKCRTELGKASVLALKCFHDEEQLHKELTTLLEMDSLITRFGLIPIKHSQNLTRLIEHAIKGGVLSINDLEHVASDILTIEVVKKYFKNIDGTYPLLLENIQQFRDLSHLEKKIHAIISPSLTIFDDASPELKRVRKKIIATEEDINTKLHTIVSSVSNYLNDTNVVLRNGHYALAVKTHDKNKVQGIIHDVSDTGMTTFIEPSIIVNLSNEIQLLKQKEFEEINRLLRMLTEQVVLHKDDVINNNHILGYLDFVSAKALYGIENNASVASISPTPLIDIKNAKHPLIAKDICIGNDFYLDDNNHILVISGPNAGGKSVALKVVGSAVIMHQCGLPILANHGAKISVFKRIYIDIGDQQSLSDELSTFSAHMKNIVEMTHVLGSKDLLIFDELGTGTDPLEGESLAKAIIKHIHFKHAIALVTSHFSGVKTFALENDYIVNASMIFDETNMSPTYKMRLGVPGKSYGLEMAQRLGLHEAIINSAKNFLELNNTAKSEQNISKLSKLITETEKLKEELSKQAINYESQIKQLNIKEIQLQKKRNKLLSSVEQEKSSILEEALTRIDEIMASVNKGNVKLHEVIEAKTKLKQQEEEQIETKVDETDFQIGDYVLIDELNINGKITRLKRQKAVILTSAGNVEVDLSSLVKTHEPKKKNISTAAIRVDEALLKRSVKLELNIIGLRVEEGLTELIKYIDDVRVKNYKQVRIIHGSGTGALRKAVHEYLSKQKYIESFRLGGLNEGGVGATVVYLK